MNTRKWLITSGVTILVFLATLALAAGLTRAQEPEAESDASGVEEAAAVHGAIPIQGRLTDASGNPLDGSYSVKATLYDASTNGNALCTDTDPVTVGNGLFNMYLDGAGACSSSDINGRRLYLGIEVESDGEMAPRQGIYPVPYAWSLRPGAIISDTASGSVLSVRNYGSGSGLSASSDSGDGLSASSDSGNAVWASTFSGDGVVASSLSGNGVGGYSIGGSGVVGSSTSGAAIDARGTGIIRSAAKSYVWVSGNDLRKKNSTDTTQFECDTFGGVKLTRGADAGSKDVMLPVTLPGQLYGQDVTLTGIDVYLKSETLPFDAITGTWVRRQTGAGSGDLIGSDGSDHYCNPACSYHLDLTQNNVLDDEHGVVYIAFQLQFSGASSYVQIGGVRLTLEHD